MIGWDQDRMTPSDVGMEEMLLEGRLQPDETNPDLAWVAAAIAAARGAASPDELEGQEHLAAAMGARARRDLDGRQPVRSLRSARRRAWVIAVCGIGVLSGGGVAAAATGSLPGPAQNIVAHTLSHVDLSVPTKARAKSPMKGNQSSHPATQPTPATSSPPTTGGLRPVKPAATPGTATVPKSQSPPSSPSETSPPTSPVTAIAPATSTPTPPPVTAPAATAPPVTAPPATSPPASSDAATGSGSSANKSNPGKGQAKKATKPPPVRGGPKHT